MLISSRMTTTVCLKWWMERWKEGAGKKESECSFQLEKFARHWRRRWSLDRIEAMTSGWERIWQSCKGRLMRVIQNVCC